MLESTLRKGVRAGWLAGWLYLLRLLTFTRDVMLFIIMLFFVMLFEGFELISHVGGDGLHHSTI